MSEIKTIRDVLNADNKIVTDWASKTFFGTIPLTMETIEDMTIASNLMAELTNKYSYLSSILSYIKIYQRQAKLDGDKEKANELTDKKEIMQRALDTVKLQHQTLSRMITIKQEINHEIQMTK